MGRVEFLNFFIRILSRGDEFSERVFFFLKGFNSWLELV